MKSGYDQFFKKARQNAVGGKPSPAKRESSSVHHSLTEKDVEAHLKKKLGVKPVKKSKGKISWKMAGLSFVGLLIASAGFVYHEDLEKTLTMVEVNFLGLAQAQTPAAPAAAERTPTAVNPETATETVESPEELDHLSKLREKKKELDSREEEIARVEAELQKQQADLEVKIKELRETREQISRMLEDRVKADDQKVETLVQMYSNMRPPQAAKVFETLDEDLAIEILGRMKKKNAADIMNLLKPEKAQVFSEKFAGYKRK